MTTNDVYAAACTRAERTRSAKAFPVHHRRSVAGMMFHLDEGVFIIVLIEIGKRIVFVVRVVLFFVLGRRLFENRVITRDPRAARGFLGAHDFFRTQIFVEGIQGLVFWRGRRRTQ